MNKFETFLKFIGKRGWIIEEVSVDDKKYNIPEVYKGKVGELEEVAQKYKLIENPEKKIWFTMGDFLEDETADSKGFQWDTFKNMCIETSVNDGKTERAWWDKRFPFIMSVSSGDYEFFAINTDDGSIEYGVEPMFEETEKVADSLDEFWGKAISGEVERFLYGRAFFGDDVDDV